MTQVDAVAVRSAIEQSFPQPDNLVIVLIGDAAKIREAVKVVRPGDRDEDHRSALYSGDEVKQRTALIAGASGLVGGECLRRLLASDAYTKVTVVTRRSLGSDAKHQKLREIVVDFAQLDRIKAELRADHVFCALGTTIRKGGIAGEVPPGGFRVSASPGGAGAPQRGKALFAGQRTRRQFEVGRVLFPSERGIGGCPARDELAEPLHPAAFRHRRRPPGIAATRALERVVAKVRTGDLSAGCGRQDCGRHGSHCPA
ncbi:MAG: hypothetical protein IPF50_09625 [Proteobacteria bacterium]|nr:hypothetical protein [Pseudomonadota bacterium]